MKRIKKFVERQLLREKPGTTDSYESYLARGKKRAGEPIEDTRANPDRLLEGEQLWGDNEVTEPQRIMAEAVEHLQGRQKEVYLLVMRANKSLAETAEILEITKAAAQIYKDRAIKFIATYCQRAIAKGEKE